MTTNAEKLWSLRAIRKEVSTVLHPQLLMELDQMIAEFAGKMKLSPTQHGFLDALRRHGNWHPRSSWSWGTDHQSVKIAESLVALGLARKVGTGRRDIPDMYEPVETANV
jgi:hypothetical protein